MVNNSQNNYNFIKMYNQNEVKYLTNDRCFIFVAGSLYEGFGNRDSDLDIYVICESVENISFPKTAKENEIIIRKKQCIIHWYEEAQIKYDIEYHTLKELRDAIQQLNSITVNDFEQIEPIEESTFELLHRFKCSLPIEGKQKYYELYNITNFSKLSLQMSIIKRHKYYGIMEDIKGAFNDGDYGTAFCALRNAVEMIIIAYLACFDLTNPNEKWLYRKIVK